MRSPLGHRRVDSARSHSPVTRKPADDRSHRRLHAPAWAFGLVLTALLVGAPGSALAANHSSAPTASPSPGVFGIGPSNATKIDGRPYYYYLAQPGSILSDHVAVENIGIVPITLSVYPTDASNSEGDGSFAFPAAAVKPVDAGTWLHIGGLPAGVSTVVVRPRSTLFLPITLSVPANASPGDHAAALIASLQGEVKNSNGQLVHLDQRVATRVFIRISGRLHPKLVIENLTAAYHGSLNPFARGDVTITYRVHNTGNVKLGGQQLVEVSGLFGSTSAPRPPDVPLLLPGGAVQQTITVHGVYPQVWMSTTVTVSATVLSGDVNPGAGPWTASTHFWAIPWALMVLIVLLVLGTLCAPATASASTRLGPSCGGNAGPKRALDLAQAHPPRPPHKGVDPRDHGCVVWWCSAATAVVVVLGPPRRLGQAPPRQPPKSYKDSGLPSGPSRCATPRATP